MQRIGLWYIVSACRQSDDDSSDAAKPDMCAMQHDCSPGPCLQTPPQVICGAGQSAVTPMPLQRVVALTKLQQLQQTQHKITFPQGAEIPALCRDLHVGPTADVLLEALVKSRAWQQRQQVSAAGAAVVPAMHTSMSRGVCPNDNLLQATAWSKVWQQDQMQQRHASLNMHPLLQAQELKQHLDGESVEPLDALVLDTSTQVPLAVPAASLHEFNTMSHHNLLRNMCDTARPDCSYEMESANTRHQLPSAFQETHTCVTVIGDPCVPKDLHSSQQLLHVKSQGSAITPDAHCSCRLDEYLREQMFSSLSEVAHVPAVQHDSCTLELPPQTAYGTAVAESSSNMEAAVMYWNLICCDEETAIISG